VHQQCSVEIGDQKLVELTRHIQYLDSPMIEFRKMVSGKIQEFLLAPTSLGWEKPRNVPCGLQAIG
jgi:hypothetical protein